MAWNTLATQSEAETCLQDQLNTLVGLLAAVLGAMDGIDGGGPPVNRIDGVGPASMPGAMMLASQATQQAQFLLERVQGLARRLGRL